MEMNHQILISIVLCSTILNENRAFEKKKNLIWRTKDTWFESDQLQFFLLTFFIYQLIEVDDKSEEESNLQVSINA